MRTQLSSVSKKIVNSWNEFSPLKHIILGRPDGCCIPPNEAAVEHKIPIDSDMKGRHGVRSAESIKNAQAQMDSLEHLLKSHGVRVDRPEPVQWDKKTTTPWWTSETEFGCMPVRDVLLTVGNEILEATMSYRSRWFEYRAYRDIVQNYWLEDHDMKWEAAPKPRLTDASYKLDYLNEHESHDKEYRLKKVENQDFVTQPWEEPLFDAADVMRLGKDLFVQHGFTTNLAGIEWLRRHFPDHRVHAVNFPGDCYPIHIDCSFVPLKPGLIMNNPTRRIPQDQKKIFERNGWDIIDAAQPAHSEPPPLCYSSTWLSMNVLVIDEKHVLCGAGEVHQIKQLKDLGFEPIPVDYRDVYAFGGSLHCSTVSLLVEIIV